MHKRTTPGPRKRFGQHFLHDRGIIQRIIDAINPSPDDYIIEIGPGRGALTGPLLQRVNHLDVIEIDRDLAAVLAEKYAAPGKLTMHRADALRFDFRMTEDRKARIIGNLPYNISTPLLFHLLEQLEAIEEMLFMLQKEVAERITAQPGSRSYGRLSIMIQSLCDTELLFTVGAGAFTPAPKVESAVIRLRPSAGKAARIKDPARFAQIVRTAFSHRRKTLRNALRGLITETGLTALEIAPTARPEELTVEDFVRLANQPATEVNPQPLSTI